MEQSALSAVVVVVNPAAKLRKICFSRNERNIRKMQKGRVRGLAQRGSTIAYGTFAIKTTDMGFISSRQIESARIAINRYMKREGQVWIRIFPDKPITSQAARGAYG